MFKYIYWEREREERKEREMQLSTRTIIIQSACENLFKSLKGSQTPYLHAVSVGKKWNRQ